MSEFTPAPISNGRFEMNGQTYMHGPKGELWPIDAIKPQDLLEDELVRKIIGFGLALSDQVSRYREHTLADLGEFDALLAQEYGLKKGGKKGNRSYKTFDALMQVEVRVRDTLEFGPGLQVAKQLFDECINEWAADARAELRIMVTDAFATDQKGQINQANLFRLFRVPSEDPRWNKAVDALRDALRVIGAKTSVELSMRDTTEDRFAAITISLSKA